jgi:hypothetical protein
VSTLSASFRGTSAGLTLAASLRTSSGVAASPQPTFSIVDHGGGHYSLSSNSIPDGFVGAVRVSDSGGEVQSVIAIAPVPSNVVQVAGETASAASVVPSNVVQVNGVSASIPTEVRADVRKVNGASASIPSVVPSNVVQVNGVSASVGGTVNATVTGISQPVLGSIVGGVSAGFPTNFSSLVVSTNGEVSAEPVTLAADGLNAATGTVRANVIQVNGSSASIPSEVRANVVQVNGESAVPAAIPANFSSMRIDSSGNVRASTVVDKANYKLAWDGIEAVMSEHGVNMRQAIGLMLAYMAGMLQDVESTTPQIMSHEGEQRVAAIFGTDGTRTGVVYTPYDGSN